MTIRVQGSHAIVGAFNQEKARVGAFSVIVKTGCGTDGSFYSTSHDDNYLDKQTYSGLYCWDIHKISTIWTIKICCLLPPPTQGRYNVGLWVFLVFLLATFAIPNIYYIKCMTGCITWRR